MVNAASGGAASGAGAGGQGVAIVRLPSGGSSSTSNGGSTNGGAPTGAGAICEAGAVPLQRPGCPEQPPIASSCSTEGLRCLYASDTVDCFSLWECYFGLWSPRGQPCVGADATPAPFNGPDCAPQEPVDGTPCNNPGSDCSYGWCPLGGSDFQNRVRCECARFKVEAQGCPID